MPAHLRRALPCGTPRVWEWGGPVPLDANHSGERRASGNIFGSSDKTDAMTSLIVTKCSLESQVKC